MNYGHGYYPGQYPQQTTSQVAASTENIKMFIAENLGMPVSLLQFVKLTEPFVNNGSEARHACPVSLLAIESYKLMQLNFFDKATIDVGYCPNCCKVVYYVEKYA